MSCSFGSVDARPKTSNNYKNKKETKTLMKTITTITTKSITTKQTTKTTTTTSMPNVLRMSCGFGSEDASAPKTPKRDFQGLWARFENEIVTINITNGDSPSISIKTEDIDLIKSVNISRDGDKFNCRGCNGGYVSQR